MTFAAPMGRIDAPRCGVAHRALSVDRRERRQTHSEAHAEHSYKAHGDRGSHVNGRKIENEELDQGERGRRLS